MLGPLIHISPAWLTPTGLSSSSITIISTLGRGKPIVPLKLRSVTKLLVPAATPSVMPQPSIIAQPVVSSQRFAVCSVAAIPPACDNFNVLKSKFLKFGLSNNPLNKVLTAGKRWNGCFDSVLINPGISRGLGISINVWPERIPNKLSIKAKI